jgi:hypothetical protein
MQNILALELLPLITSPRRRPDGSKAVRRPIKLADFGLSAYDRRSVLAY